MSTDLQKAKEFMAELKKIFPEATEKQIAEYMIDLADRVSVKRG
jgi:hypothetical protein